MRTTYHELVGKHVVDADRRRIGRVADLVADNVDGRLRVTGLLVGQEFLLGRFGLTAAEVMLGGHVHGYVVPWEAIAAIGKEIRLKVVERDLPVHAKVSFIGEKA